MVNGLLFFNLICDLSRRLLHRRVSVAVSTCTTCSVAVFTYSCYCVKRLPFIAYVDFSNVFDTVVRNQLLEKMKNNGLSTKSHKFLSIIIFRINYFRICISDFVSDRIKQNRGLLQGDPLSPLLFILFRADLAFILSIFVSCYFYADDLSIVTDSTQQMTEALESLEVYCRENNLTVNISKTKMIKIRKRGHTGRK